jgi:hypothetical protein
VSTHTDIKLSPIELAAVRAKAELADDDEEAKMMLQDLACAYGLPPLPGKARYGLDLETGVILAP